MNKIELALNQLDPETIKSENDLSFKIPLTTIEKNLEEKSDTPDITPPIPKSIIIQTKITNSEIKLSLFLSFS